MIVVTIVGILATIGVVGYRKMVNAAHVGEATQMIQSIRVAQESFRAETGSYANISNTLSGDLCPSASVTASKVPWDPECNGGKAKWSVLPVHVDAPVLFRYTAVAGRAGEDLPAAPTGMTRTVSFGTGKTTRDWFAAAAKADTDNNGAYVFVVGTSWSNDVFIDSEGE